MREEFYETSACPENVSLQKSLYGVANAFLIFFLIVFIISAYLWFFIAGDTGFLAIMMISSFFIAILFLLKRRLYLFYDYTYISGDVRIIKVLNGKTRRRVAVFDVKEIIQVGKVGSNSFDEIVSMKDVKKIIATPNGMKAKKQLYYIYANVDGAQSVIVLECDERFLSYVVSTRGKTIIEKDYK